MPGNITLQICAFHGSDMHHVRWELF